MPGLPLSGQREIVRRLPDLGYTDAWAAEAAGADGFTPLALASQWAPELRLGTAIVPVYTRGPALLAQQAATLAALAPGRFVLGLGSSSPAIVEAWNGIAFEEPFQKVRDTLRFLRRALAGEKITETYPTFTVSGFALEEAPAIAPRIALAALRPGMLRLAAREADMAITNWLAPRDVQAVRGVIGDALELAAPLFTIPTRDADAARALGRRMIAAYLTVPAYAAFHDWLGRGEALRPMRRAWAAGDRKAALAAIPDHIVDDLIVHGSPAACRARIREYIAGGLSTPIIGFVTTGGMSPTEAVQALSPSAD